MNAITLSSVKAALRFGVLAGAAICLSFGQTLINLGTQGRNIDFSNAPSTRPVKTGTTLPTSCSIGALFFNTSAPAGQNLYACTSSNVWSLSSSASGLNDPGANGIVQRTGSGTTIAVPAPGGTIVGTTDAQTLTNKSIDGSEIATGIISAGRIPAFSGDFSTSAGSTAATLATVNSAPGTYGDGSHTVQLSVDGKGRVTAISQVAMLGGNGSSSIAAGPLASISATCTPGTLYLATDQAAGQQIYTCSATNTWTQVLSIGPSGALAVTNGSLDIVTSVVPLLTAANTFSGLNTFANGVQIQGTNSQPTCSSTLRGLLWFQNNGSSKDGIQSCVYNGSSFAWISLY